jgi:dihydrofolate reductase
VKNEQKLILQMQMSLDGFVGGPNGEVDWIFPHFDEGSTAWIVESLWQAGIHIMGSKTFRDMAAYWPSSTEPYAPPMNEIPKVVFSRRGLVESAGTISTTPALRDALRNRTVENATSDTAFALKVANWANSKVVGGDLDQDIAQLKRESRKPILAHGGAGFVQSLVRGGLIDEYRLVVHPIVLRTGLRLFPEGNHPIELRMMETKVFAKGTVAHVYRPA